MARTAASAPSSVLTTVTNIHNSIRKRRKKPMMATTTAVQNKLLNIIVK